MTESKVFFGATKQDAEQAAKQWWAQQTGLVKTLNSWCSQNVHGAWSVTLYFRKDEPPGR